MMRLLNLLHLPLSVFRILHYVHKQKGFIDKRLDADLEPFLKQNDGSLSEKDLKKIRRFYGLIIPAFVGEGYALLRGKAMQPNERMAISYLGGITGLFDDFFDEESINLQDLKKILDDPFQAIGTNSNQSLFIFGYQMALSHCRFPEKVKEYGHLVYQAQIESQKQIDPQLSLEEIQRITIEKGARSFLFYRMAFDTLPGPEEELFLYKIGGFFQVCSDVFDVYKDLEAGIHTLVTRSRNIEEIAQLIRSLQAECYTLAYQMPYPKRQIKAFLRFISLINSRTFVCMEMLYKLQKNKGGIFEPEKYEREELICDMEKASNLLKCGKYYIADPIHPKT